MHEVVAERAHRAHPHRAAGLGALDLLGAPAQPVHIADVEGLAAGHPLELLRQRAQVLPHLVGDRRQGLGIRDLAGRRQLMLETPLLRLVKGGGEREDRAAAAAAVTRRVVNDRPSRSRSTWYTIGTPGCPGRRKYACSECTGRSPLGGAAAATSAWPATWPPKTRCSDSSGCGHGRC